MAATQRVPDSDSGILAAIARQLEQVPELPDYADEGWRREVSHKGARWHWRKGSGKQRRFRPGGRFETLPESVQKGYHARIARRQATNNS